MNDQPNKLQSKYLGQLKVSNFARWKFERPLALHSFKEFKIPVIFTKYFVEEYPNLVNDIDSFVEKILFKDKSDAFAETVEDSLYGLLLEKFIYRFNFKKGQYDLFLPTVDQSKIWKGLTISLEIVPNEEATGFSYVFVAEYHSFSSANLRDNIKLVFNQNAELSHRAYGDDDISLNAPVILLPLTGEYYFNERDDLWRACKTIPLIGWENYPIRGEFYGWDKSKENEGQIDQLFLDFSKRTQDERILNDSEKLRVLLEIYLDGYPKDYEEYPFIADGVLSIETLWRLISPPKILSIMTDNGHVYLIVFHDCLWDQEHGMHFIYDKNLRLVKVGAGSDPYI